MPHQEIATTDPEGFEQTTSGTVVTGQRRIADGGADKEAVVLNPQTGASSDAPPSSGIPSAMTQQGVQREAVADQEETFAAGHQMHREQNLKP